MIVVVGLSGLVMAGRAYAGPIAGLGFATLAIATMFSGLAAAYYAIHRQLETHQRWAVRCFVLLCSPMLLRIVGGILYVTDLESHVTYQLNAWLSWIVPLAVVVVASRRHKYVRPPRQRWREASTTTLT